MKRVLFIDRDGTLIQEPIQDQQVDSLEKLEFLPKVFRNLHLIKQKLDFEFVIVTNQDGLGTASFPEETFYPAHQKFLKAFENEGVIFDDILIDRHFPSDNHPNRKPGIGMLAKYLTGDYDLAGSYVIGDRLTDIQLAKNIGAKGILIGTADGNGLQETIALQTNDWDEITLFLASNERTAVVERKTKETEIYIQINLDGNGKTTVNTGLKFFDHMLEQIGRHSGCDLTINVKGDLEVDEHHTIEDTAIALGEAIYKALGNKRGIERYGFCLPMDDSLVLVALDFGGRAWLEWEASFIREKVGDMPTEMFYHFFKSFSDAAKCNLNIKAQGVNEHHKIEGIFKALAKAIKSAIRKEPFNYELPTTKGML